MGEPRPPLAPGEVLAGRYRLDRLVADGPVSATWLATDEVLARPVAVRIAAAGTHPQAAEAFVAAAGQAGSVAHPCLARVYDAALEPRSGGTRRSGQDLVAFVVSEWVDGRSLAEALADGPLRVPVAAAAAVQAAEAVAACHAAGVAHGRLTAGNLLLATDGRVKVTDGSVAAALRGTTSGPDPFTADTRDLAALLYAALTGRWPAGATTQPACGLPPAPLTGTEPCSPRQVRAGVPRALDVVVSRGLEADREPTATASAGAAAFAAAVAHASPPPGERPEAVDPLPARRGLLARRPSLPPRLRRAAPLALSLAFLLAVGLTTYALGRSVGALPGRPGASDALAQATPSASPGGLAGTVRPLDLAAAPVSVRDYNPLGDGTESHSTVVNSYDKDPSTAWVTSHYTNERFGGLKSGVGLLVDLGKPTTVRRVELALTTAGADVELRAADVAGTAADPLPPVVASAHGVGGTASVVLSPPAGTTARFWLVWLTRLPRDPAGGFREGVAEMAFFAPA